ncbi:MAG TPA: GNAT family N-acetyltransferase [Burkholderiales bacterium]|nr:GNAT family N-acetyltransferase [Burkholderiales bacterium]
MIELRLAHRDDLETLVPLVMAYHRFEEVDMPEPVVREAVAPLLGGSDHGRIWLIHHEGKCAGYIALCLGYSIEFAGREAFIDELYLHEQYRGRGIGRDAIQEVVRQAAPLGVRAVHLEVGRENETAQQFYSAMGFAPRSRYFLMTRYLDGKE